VLAASLKSPFENGLFTLALNLSKKNEPNVPSSVVEYFDQVLKQIRCVLERPGEVIRDISPEALDIAMEIESESCLYKDILELENFQSLTPEKASHLLQEMEALSVC
jgi:hypothetical protein